MIEIMKTTEVNIKMDERLQVTEKTADDQEFDKKTYKQHTQSDFQKLV